ncbi:hypothetical protein OA46_22510 [Enterobacter cloacae]|nr:hypothetical protein OA46_22510 [Enterobacter cloacae]
MLFGISFMSFILISFRLFKLTICISKIFVIERFSFRVSPVSGGFQITLKRYVIKQIYVGRVVSQKHQITFMKCFHII